MNIAIIFDMDGVLIDSVGSNWKAINKALEPYEAHVNDDEISQLLGRSLNDQVRLLDKRFMLNLDYDDFAKSVKDIKDSQPIRFALKPGTTSLLKEAHSNKITMALATSMPRIITEQRLGEAGILDYFDVLITSDDVIAHKPDPEVYLAASTRLKIDTKNCLVFEDAPNGVQAAKAAGAYCIAIKTPYVRSSDLKKADIVIDSLEDINLQQITYFLTNN